MVLFKKGFLKYLKSGKHADIVLICNGQHYKAHRAILAHSSAYFDRLLLSEFREASQPYVSLGFPDPQDVFPELLAFMYTGRVVITLHNVIPLLAVADHYLVEDLCSLCDTFLQSNIQRDTALIIIKSALDFHFADITSQCITVIAKNFSHLIPDADYSFLPPALFLQLLQHPYLVVRNEFALYQLVCKYIHAHTEIQSQQVDDMMGTIRFVWMTYDELARVSSNPLVPRPLMIETCMERLKKFEALPSLRTIRRHSVYDMSLSAMLDCDNPRFRPRPPQSYIFVPVEYPSDFDSHGVMYHIATQGGTSPWVNPVTAGRIHILASSFEKGSPPDIVEMKPQDVWSRDVPSSWISIDLGPKRAVVPTAYTLRHGMNFRSDSLRTWDLQGSINGENWSLCRRHTNDQALNSGYAFHTWKISPAPPSATSAPIAAPTSPSTSPTMTITRPPPAIPPSSPPPPSITPFRYFRILQTGRNSNNRNFLVALPQGAHQKKQKT